MAYGLKACSCHPLKWCNALNANAWCKWSMVTDQQVVVMTPSHDHHDLVFGLKVSLTSCLTSTPNKQTRRMMHLSCVYDTSHAHDVLKQESNFFINIFLLENARILSSVRDTVYIQFEMYLKFILQTKSGHEMFRISIISVDLFLLLLFRGLCFADDYLKRYPRFTWCGFCLLCCLLLVYTFLATYGCDANLHQFIPNRAVNEILNWSLNGSQLANMKK